MDIFKFWTTPTLYVANVPFFSEENTELEEIWRLCQGYTTNKPHCGNSNSDTAQLQLQILGV